MILFDHTYADGTNTLGVKYGPADGPVSLDYLWQEQQLVERGNARWANYERGGPVPMAEEARACYREASRYARELAVAEGLDMLLAIRRGHLEASDDSGTVKKEDVARCVANLRGRAPEPKKKKPKKPEDKPAD